MAFSFKLIRTYLLHGSEIIKRAIFSKFDGFTPYCEIFNVNPIKIESFPVAYYLIAALKCYGFHGKKMNRLPQWGALVG